MIREGCGDGKGSVACLPMRKEPAAGPQRGRRRDRHGVAHRVVAPPGDRRSTWRPAGRGLEGNCVPTLSACVARA